MGTFKFISVLFFVIVNIYILCSFYETEKVYSTQMCTPLKTEAFVSDIKEKSYKLSCTEGGTYSVNEYTYNLAKAEKQIEINVTSQGELYAVSKDFKYEWLFTLYISIFVVVIFFSFIAVLSDD